MSIRFTLLISVVLALGFIAQPALAQLDAGFMLWKHRTELDVDNAVDFDGTSDTGEERGKNWDTQGSGFGVSASYQFPRILQVFAELGLAQSIVSFEDISDPARDVRTLAMDNSVHVAIGARPQGTLPNNPRVFWSGGVVFSAMNSELARDVQRSWDYDETTLSVDGRIGYLYQNLGFYGGLRFAKYNADLNETDIGNAVGQQLRTVEFSREASTDLLLGVQTNGSTLSGAVEFGFIGSLSARAGITRSF